MSLDKTFFRELRAHLALLPFSTEDSAPLPACLYLCAAAAAVAEMLQPGPNAAKLISGCYKGEANLLITGDEAFCHQALMFYVKSNFDVLSLTAGENLFSYYIERLPSASPD